MKRDLIKVLALSIAVGFGLTACHTHHPEGGVVVTPGGEIVVPEAPPSPRTETAGAPPTSSYTWIQGYWTYHEGRWVWVPGHWDAPPTPGEKWVQGYWTHKTNGWLWTQGHWE